MKPASNHTPLKRIFVLLLALFLIAPSPSHFEEKAGSAPAAPHAAPAAIPAMLEQVTTAALVGYVSGLSGEEPVQIGGNPFTLSTRYSRTEGPIQLAGQYVYERFQSLGLQTAYDDYNLPGTGTRQNVIAVQPGLAPGCIYLVGAHLDDTAQLASRMTYAPGADDNASGSAAVLIAAEILSQYDFVCTLRYALFTGEEQGLYGSAAYAAQVKDQGEDLRGALILDMIAYDSDGNPRMELHTRPGAAGDLAIASAFSGAVSAYQINLKPRLLQDGVTYSDHASFWEQGFSAILAIEDDRNDYNPYYHTTRDRLNTLNPAYLTEFTRAVVAVLVHQAGLLGSTNYYLPLVVERTQ